jgi:hypothetical protein
MGFGEEKPLREQLREALSECRRQIQILKFKSGPGYGVGGRAQDNSREIELMEAEARRLRGALQSLGEDNA